MIQNSLYPFLYEQIETDNNIKEDGSVAIIMRTKNRPVLLARAISSVVEQSYQNWHLYIVNDGGNQQDVDNLVENYQEILNDRITVIHNPKSLGMESASNCAFNIAYQEFMVIHDDDDSWHPDFLSETVSFLKKDTQAVAVITNCFVVHEEIQGETVKELAIFDWSCWKDFIDIHYLLQSNVAPPICMLIRMKVAKLIGGYNENLPVLGDWDYNLRLFRVGEIKTINKKLAYYHHRPNANNVYGNSIIHGVNKHLQYQTEYRNALVRQALLEQQSNYGLLHLLLHDADKHKHEIIWHIHNKQQAQTRDAELYEMVYFFYRPFKAIHQLFKKIESTRKRSKLRPLAHRIRNFFRKVRAKV